MAIISQREARRLRKQVAQLQTEIKNQRRTYGQEFRGVNIATMTYSDRDHFFPAVVRTARRLGHVVVIVGDESGELRLMALPHPSESV